MIPPAITVDDVEGEADCGGKSKKVEKGKVSFRDWLPFTH